MPERFDERLTELGIPFTPLEKGKTKVDAHKIVGKFHDAHELWEQLSEIMAEPDNDARLVTSDGDSYEFGPLEKK